MSDLLDAMEETKEKQTEILVETSKEVLSALENAISTGRELGVRAIPINKLEEYVKGIVKSGFNTVSCKKGLGPVME